MLQNMREKSQGLITWFIVLFIVGAFAFFGLTEYFSFGRSQSVAAKVNGEKITWRTVNSMYERLARQYAGQVDPRALKEQIRMSLVQRSALTSKAKALGFQVGDDQVANALVQIPVFQENGQFSKERYLRVLSETAYSDVGFRQELAYDILLGQLEQGLSASSFTMPSELNYTVSLLDQKRDFGYLIIPAKSYEKDIKISAADSKKYYEAHKDQFVKPEQVSLEYVELSFDDLMKPIKVSKEEVMVYYNEHKAAYTSPEQVRARHILIPSNKEETAKNTAKEKAENLLAEIKKGGDFQALAKKHSIDTGSAEKGGDLGWFSRGQMVPEFEKAAFDLKKPGDLSQVVESQFGYHIIQLIEHKTPEVRSFAEAKSLAEEQLRSERAQALFAEKGQQLAKLAFEQSTTLKPVAEQMGLKIQETELFGKQGGKGIASRPEVINIAFGEAVLKQNHNSEAIKLPDNRLIVVHLKTHQPAAQQAYEAVITQINEKLSAEAAKAKVKEVAEGLVKRLANGEKPQELAKQANLEWKSKSGITRFQTKSPDAREQNIQMAAFHVPSVEVSNGAPGIKVFPVPGKSGDLAVLAVTKVIPGEMESIDSATKNAYQQSLTDVSSQIEFALYANQVLKEAKIELAKEAEAAKE